MSAVTPFALASELGVLAIGRDPSGQAHNSPNGQDARPANSTDGAPTLDAVVALVGIDVRENPGYRTVRFEFGSLDAGAEDITVTINGNTVVIALSGGETEGEALFEIADAMNSDPTISADVVAAAVDANDEDTVNGTNAIQVRVRGLTEADFTANISTDGASVVTGQGDINACTADVFYLRTAAPNTTPDNTWRKSKTSYTVDQDNCVERHNVAGLRRVYVRITGTTYSIADGGNVSARPVGIDVAPAIVETS